MIGYKLLRADGRSLSSVRGAHQYGLDGSWQDVPGNGSYVALSLTGLLRGGYGPLLAEVEYEQPTGAVDDGHGVTARRVRVLQHRFVDAATWAGSAGRSAAEARASAARASAAAEAAWAAGSWAEEEAAAARAAEAAARAVWEAARAARAAARAEAAKTAAWAAREAEAAAWAAREARAAAREATMAARAEERAMVLTAIMDE